MKYEIEWKPSALREFKKLPADLQAETVRHVECLAEDSRPNGCRKLTGFDDVYRIRIGDLRLIYPVEDSFVRVLILRMRHRRESYRDLQ